MWTFHRLGIICATGFLKTRLLVSALLVSLPLTVLAGTPTEPPADWLSMVQRDIAALEYQVTYQEHTPFAGLPRAYQAPNRAQNFRTYFTPTGIRAVPRDSRRDEAPAWEWGLEWRTCGRAGAMQPVAQAVVGTNGNRVEYRRGDLVEWYVNDPRGLEQGFMIQQAPSSGAASGPRGSGSPLRLDFEVGGNVKAVPTDGCDAVDFLAPGGARAVHFGELHATDATGAELPSWFESRDSALSIVVDDCGATYPIAIDPLATSPNWTAEGDQAAAGFGSSVATAGDVNGDGYSDVIVGAPSYDDGPNGRGRAFVYYGSAAGLSAVAAWPPDDAQFYLGFGSAVATAGDVNGDGYSDVVVTALGDHLYYTPRWAYVYHGSAAGLSASADWAVEFDQADGNFGVRVAAAGDVNGDGYGDLILGTGGHAYVYHGSAAGLSASATWNHDGCPDFGQSVATAGDVNGDGYSDVIVGAIECGMPSEGLAFVYHGSPAGLSDTASWVVEGFSHSALLGLSVGSAGDVNGDGYSDVIVGAPDYNNGQGQRGWAFVYHGSPTGLSGASAWTAESNQAGAFFGSSVATAGDVNGDGHSDVIIGARYYDNGQTDEGRAFVYLGSAGGLSGAAAWTAECDQAGAEFGASVATAGDVNGDGYSDVIVGAYMYDNGQTDEGRAYVYHGSAAGLSAAAGWTAEGNQAGSGFGWSVASAEDVNGDGYGDVIVGAPFYDNGQADEGRAFVYPGSAAGLSSTAIWTAEGDQAGAFFGVSVASAGDVNGDGYGDVIVGAERYDNGQTDEGRAFVYHGSTAGPLPTATWTAEGNQTNAYFGGAVATAGDVNGDGYGDVIVGANAYDNGQSDEGRAFVYQGSAAGLSAAAAWTAEGDQAGAGFGRSVATAGDVNGDGFSDVIVGAHTYDNGEINEGRAFVYHGTAVGLAAAPAWTTESNQADALFGCAVGAAGDVNGDGFSDVIIGANAYGNGQNHEGRAFVYQGSAAGLSAAAAWTAESDQAEAWFGSTLGTAGDVNGDGYSDVIVGAYAYDNDQADEGRAFVYQGSAAGLSAVANWTAESDQAGAYLGCSVAAAGDVNGDGYGDVIVGACGTDNGESDEGQVLLYFGNAGAGRTSLPRQMRTDGVTTIASLGISDSGTGFRIRGMAPSVFGRTQLQMEYEVKPLRTFFDGVGTVTDDFLDTGADGQIDGNHLVSGLSRGTPYHWRVRTKYDPVKTPFQRSGPWVHIPLRGWNEAQLRTAAQLAGIEESDGFPARFDLRAAGPNPVRGACSVELILSHPGNVRAKVIDASGHKVADLVEGEFYPAGSHLVTWDGRTQGGERAAAGVYFVHVQVDAQALTRKLVVVR